jgi:hypothetical protein
MKKDISLVILATILIVSCKDEIVTPSTSNIVVVNPSDQYFPTAIGNTWNYVDSLIYDDHAEVSTHETKIVKDETIKNKLWHIVDGLDIGQMSFSYFYWQDNKIYSRFVTWVPNEYTEGVKLIAAVKYGKAYPMVLGSDTEGIFVYAVHYKKNYAIKNFIFTEYFEYTYNTGLEIHKVIIVPGVGVVDYQKLAQDYPGRQGYFYRSTLEKYSIKK